MKNLNFKKLSLLTLLLSLSLLQACGKGRTDDEDLGAVTAKAQGGNNNQDNDDDDDDDNEFAFYGDCNADGRISGEELHIIKYIVQGSLPLEACENADLDLDGVVVQGELDFVTPLAYFMPSDCDDDGIITSEELHLALGVAVGSHDLSECYNADLNNDDRVMASEVLQAAKTKAALED